MVHPYPSPLMLEKPLIYRLRESPWKPRTILITNSLSISPCKLITGERQVQVLDLPRAIRSTLMIRMMVGLMGSEALTSISSSVMPMMDRSTIARSSWFHLENRECSSLSGGREHGGRHHGGTEN